MIKNKNVPKTEFRYNRKRKHYSYIYGQKGNLRKNILISSKPEQHLHKNNGKIILIKNVPLYKHPNPNSNEQNYLMPRKYVDHKDSFGKQKKSWKFHPFDRRKVKRIKKGKKY